MALTFWAFTGGAHGYGSTSCTLVDLRTGRTVAPQDVFAAGSPWLREVVAIVGADLKKQFVDNPGFEDALGRGEPPEVEVLTHSAHPPAQAGTRQLLRLLQGFQQEQATLRLALRGVAPGSLEALHIEERDLADPAARGAQLSGMLPFFVLMAMVYGLLTAALDSTAGERERGSLEPLLLNPAPVAALVAGKWAAVMALGVLIAVLGCLSFLPGQWLLRSDTLAAMFRFGAGEALAFIGLLVPLAALLGAVLMAVAIRCRTVKEAQASAGLVVFATSLAPLVPLFSQQGEAPWHLWLPVLAQVTLMGPAVEVGTVIRDVQAQTDQPATSGSGLI